MTSLRLVYITGKGHSGSTLLDMLIGSHSECITLGEIHQLTLKAEGVCACGAANYRECEFWRDVDSRLRADGLAGLSALHVDSADQDEFRHSNHALFRVLQEKTNARWFVDSSKKLPRLKSLLSDPPWTLSRYILCAGQKALFVLIWQKVEILIPHCALITLDFGRGISICVGGLISSSLMSSFVPARNTS